MSGRGFRSSSSVSIIDSEPASAHRIGVDLDPLRGTSEVGGVADTLRKVRWPSSSAGDGETNIPGSCRMVQLAAVIARVRYFRLAYVPWPTWSEATVCIPGDCSQYRLTMVGTTQEGPENGGSDCAGAKFFVRGVCMTQHPCRIAGGGNSATRTLPVPTISSIRSTLMLNPVSHGNCHAQEPDP
jgi:hypothetical protein